MKLKILFFLKFKFILSGVGELLYKYFIFHKNVENPQKNQPPQKFQKIFLQLYLSKTEKVSICVARPEKKSPTNFYSSKKFKN